MISYIFYRESNDFADVLDDINIKKYFKQKVSWRQHLLIMSNSVTSEIQSYIMLKYGDDLRTWDHIRKDNSPIPYKDYSPDPDRPKKYKDVYK